MGRGWFRLPRRAYATLEVFLVLLLGAGATGLGYWAYEWHASNVRAQRFLSEVDAVLGAAATLYDPQRGYANVSNVSVCRVLARTAVAADWCQTEAVEVSPAVAADPDDPDVVARDAVMASRLLATLGSHTGAHGFPTQWFICAAARYVGVWTTERTAHRFVDSMPCVDLLATADAGFPGTVLERARVNSDFPWAAGFGRRGERRLVTDHDGDGELDAGDGRLPDWHPAWHHLRLVFYEIPPRLCQSVTARPLAPGWRAVLTTDGSATARWLRQTPYSELGWLNAGMSEFIEHLDVAVVGGTVLPSALRCRDGQWGKPQTRSYQRGPALLIVLGPPDAL